MMIAHSTAATTEGNSSSTPSPVVLTSLPPKARTIWPAAYAPFAHELRRADLVLAHEARIADHVGGKDGREPTCRGHGAGLKGSSKPLSGAHKNATGSFVDFGMAARPCCTDR
jgi:hypothetical protein